jgi:hypothetical protein
MPRQIADLGIVGLERQDRGLHVRFGQPGIEHNHTL